MLFYFSAVERNIEMDKVDNFAIVASEVLADARRIISDTNPSIHEYYSKRLKTIVAATQHIISRHTSVDTGSTVTDNDRVRVEVSMMSTMLFFYYFIKKGICAVISVTVWHSKPIL